MAYKSLTKYRQEQKKQANTFRNIRNGGLALAFLGVGGYFGGPYAYEAAKDYAAEQLVSNGITSLPFIGDLQGGQNRNGQTDAQPAAVAEQNQLPQTIVVPGADRPETFVFGAYRLDELARAADPAAPVTTDTELTPKIGFPQDYNLAFQQNEMFKPLTQQGMAIALEAIDIGDDTALIALLTMYKPTAAQTQTLASAAIDTGFPTALQIILSQPEVSGTKIIPAANDDTGAQSQVDYTDATVTFTVKRADPKLNQSSLALLAIQAQSAENPDAFYPALLPLMTDDTLKLVISTATSDVLKTEADKFLPHTVEVPRPAPVQTQPEQTEQQTGGIWDWVQKHSPF